MSKSDLCHKIDLCNSLATLNDAACVEIIQLMQHESGYKNLNQLLLKMVIKITQNMTVESIERINNRIKQMSQMDNFTLQLGYSGAAFTHKSTSINDDKTVFPLLRLPIDIIKNASLFLNEKDIFKFEKCCRSFYQMINNLSYLKQTNNFKRFEINNKRWKQIIDPKYSFYKYSQSKVLVIMFNEINNNHERTTESIGKIQSKWEQAGHIAKRNGDWLINLFKSIESLILYEDATMTLLNKLPLDILFDEQSKFQSLTIDHYWNDNNSDHLQKTINEFENQYLQLKQKYFQENKKIKKLKQIEHDVTYATKITGPSCVETQNLILNQNRYGFTMQLEDMFCNPTIKTLTCKRDFRVDISTLDKINCKCKIETLRLINFCAVSETSICVNDTVIETLNLHRNVVNLTVEISYIFSNITNNKEWMKTIEKILLKQHYHNLKNFNLLIQLEKKNLKQLFDMLKKNVGILKRQFNKLNVGLKISDQTRNDFTHTFEWNCEIDCKFLDEKQQQLLCHQAKQSTNEQFDDSDMHKENFEKFLNCFL